MKTTIFILALFCFSFSLESFTQSEELVLENIPETSLVWHWIGSEGEYIELYLPIEAAVAHLLHGDTLACIAVPPDVCD